MGEPGGAAPTAAAGAATAVDTRQLDEILKGLRALQDDRVYQDVEELARLQTAVAEGMKRFEFALRRRAEGANGQPVLSGSDEVPEQFRKLVEQYAGVRTASHSRRLARQLCPPE